MNNITKRIEELTEQINQKFTNWSFVGSIVDWYYLKGQILIKDFDIVTSDPFEPTYNSPFWGPRTSFVCMSRTVDVFQDTPTATKIPTIEEHLENLRWLESYDTKRADKYRKLIDHYESVINPAPPVSVVSSVCPHRGIQTRTLDQFICKTKTTTLDIYQCNLFEKECTHRKVCSKQDPEILICVGCKREKDGIHIQ